MIAPQWSACCLPAIVNRRIVRHRNPRGGGYEQLDEIVSGALPLPTLGTELDLAELL